MLVTGGGGFVGRRLLAALTAQGANTSGWTREEVDLRDGAAVAQAMRRLEPRTIFHLAAAAVGGPRAHDPALIGEDVAMIQSLLSTAPAGARLVMTGSMAEYGRGGRHHEDDQCEPRTAYAIARLAAGNLALAYGPARGLQVTLARLYGVYGPGEAQHRLFPMVVEGLSAGRPVALSDGLQRRDFIHVDDVCRALIAIASVPGGECPPIVNVGTGVAVRVRDAIEWLADALGAPRSLLRFGTHARSPGDQDLLVADVGRLKDLLGSVPPQRLAPGLAAKLFTDGR